MLKYVVGAALLASAFSFTTTTEAEARAACPNGQILRVNMGRCVSKHSRAAAPYVHVARAKRGKRLRVALAHHRHLKAVARHAPKVIVRTVVEPQEPKVIVRTVVKKEIVYRDRVVHDAAATQAPLTAIKASNRPASPAPTSAPVQTNSPFGSLVKMAD